MSEAEPNVVEPNVDQLSDVIDNNPDPDEAAATKAAAEAAAATAAGAQKPEESKVIWPEKWREQIIAKRKEIIEFRSLETRRRHLGRKLPEEVE